MGSLQSYTIPFPSGGWNARDAFDSMPETDAIALQGIIPRGNYGEVAAIDTQFADNTDGTNTRSLFSFSTASGTNKLIMADADGDIWDVSAGGNGTQIYTTSTNGYFQHVVFKNRLFLVNGTDAPIVYDGTTIAAVSPQWNGSGLTATDLVDVTAYKQKLYFLESGSASFWYSATSAVNGTTALTEFDCSEFLKRGGSLEWISSWTNDTGSGLLDYLVLMSDQGEVLVYAGDDPSTTDWYLQGRYYVGEPLGRRSKTNIGNDLVMLTREGALSLGEVLRNAPMGGQYIAYTDKIQNAFREDLAEHGKSTGWRIIAWPKENLAFINVPLASEEYNVTYGLNTKTGAWFSLKSGWTDFAVFGGDLYVLKDYNFNESAVYKAFAGTTSTGYSEINPTIWTSFTALGAANSEKFLHDIRPALRASTDAQVGVDTIKDYQLIHSGAVAVPAASMASVPSSGGFSDKLYQVGEFGRSFAVGMRISYTSTQVTINNIRMYFEPSYEPL